MIPLVVPLAHDGSTAGDHPVGLGGYSQYNCTGSRLVAWYYGTPPH
jgi:hypothetical protein